jgi:hypothetical protein
MKDTTTMKRTLSEEDTARKKWRSNENDELDWSDEASTADGAAATTGITSRYRQTKVCVSYPYTTRIMDIFIRLPRFVTSSLLQQD